MNKIFSPVTLVILFSIFALTSMTIASSAYAQDSEYTKWKKQDDAQAKLEQKLRDEAAKVDARVKAEQEAIRKKLAADKAKEKAPPKQ